MVYPENISFIYKNNEMKNYKIRQESIDFCNAEENHLGCQAKWKNTNNIQHC